MSESGCRPDIDAMVRFLVAAGFTRQQIAERIGVSRRALYGWTAGTMRPTAKHIEALRTFMQQQPVHAAAAHQAAQGRLSAWPRRPAVRSPETYEQDVIWV